MSELICCVRLGNLQKVRELLEQEEQQGIDINVQNKFGSTALIIASHEGKLEIVKLLVEKGAKISIKNKWGTSAFLTASIYGHLEIIKFFVLRSAKINIRNKNGDTALMWAVSANYFNFDNNIQIVKFLIEQGADINDRNNKGDTTIDFALRRGCKDMVTYLRSLKGTLSLQHITLNLIDKKGISKEGLPDILFVR